MDSRFRQANKEAGLALSLTLFYLLAWCSAAYLLNDSPGLLGFPRWFEGACIVVPLLFIAICYWTVKRLFKSMRLDAKPNES